MEENQEKKVTALFRKLKINDKEYYQCNFIVPEFVPNERFDNLSKRNKSSKAQFYVTATEEELNRRGIKPNVIFYENRGLHVLKDIDEFTLVSKKFEEDSIIKEHFNKVQVSKDEVDTLVDNIFSETKCQKGATREIVQTINFNRELNQANLSPRDKYVMHDNIVFFGPMASGKSMVLKSLSNHIDIPVITLDLEDVGEINKEMLVEALENSNKEFNGDAVVVCNLDYDKFRQLFEGDSFYPLKELCNAGNLFYSDKLKKPVNFRELTYVTCVDVGENMYQLGSDNLDAYFMHMSGCTKPIGVNRLNLLQMRKVLLESSYSKLKFCEEIAKKNKRSFSYNPKSIATLLHVCDKAKGNIMMIDAAIMESFKLQLNSGVKNIIIGDETIVILQGIMNREMGSAFGEEPEIEEDDEEMDTNDIPRDMKVSDAISDKERAIDDLSKKIKEIIKGQDNQVRDLATAIIDNQEIANDPKEEYPESNKVNILVRGSSGTGKTEIIRIIAKSLGIPMVVEDATRYTEEGYVGESVTEMLLDLYRETGENIEKAERGIIVIDEIDKKASNDTRNIDVSRSAVLNSLLKMIEGETYQLDYKVPTPMGMTVKKIKIDTRRITFIVLGAFDGLDKIKEDRIKKAEKPKSMGFQTEADQNAVAKELEGINREFVNKDYITFGFTDQFINRFDEKIYLNKIDRNTMIEIMKYSLKSPLLLLQNRFAKYGIEIEYTEDFCEKLADIAMTKDSGARSIKEVFSDLKKFVGFNRIRKSRYSKIVFTKECFDNPAALQLIEKTDVKKFIKE